MPNDDLHPDLRDLGDDPVAAVAAWIDDARRAGVAEPDAAVLATATLEGRPSARAVLLRQVRDGEVVFFTNLDSRKGRELATNPWAAICAVWPDLRRQVRLEGTVAPASAELSDDYWATRPHGSRLAALASPQSQPITARGELHRRYDELAARYPEGTVPPRPSWWGGLALRPVVVEFWRGRSHRLHDRVRYDLVGDGMWETVRLAP